MNKSPAAASVAGKPGPAAALAAVGLRVGALALAFEARGVRALHRQPPGPRSVDIEPLLGLAVPATGPRQWLSLHGAPGLALAVPAPVELISIPAAAIRPLPALLAASCGLPGLRALAQDDPARAPLLLLELSAELAAHLPAPPSAARLKEPAPATGAVQPDKNTPALQGG